MQRNQFNDAAKFVKTYWNVSFISNQARRYYKVMLRIYIFKKNGSKTRAQTSIQRNKVHTTNQNENRNETFTTLTKPFTFGQTIRKT